MHFRRLLGRLRRRGISQPRRLKSVDAYALWAEHYPPFAHNRLMEIEQAALLGLVPSLAGCRVLDLACGSGRYGLLAAQNGASLVVGVDNSVPMLQVGIAAGVTYPMMQAAMPALPFGTATFDVVLCGLATGHLQPDQMRQSLAEMGRILRPGGHVLISDFHPAIYAQGGRRTFTATDGTSYEVEHYPHSLADYTAAGLAANLEISAVDESVAGTNGVIVNTPVILAIHYRRHT